MALRLMCIFAHPDDESMGTGPTLAKYVTTSLDTGQYTRTAWRAIACRRSQLRDYEKLEGLGPEQWQATVGRQTYYRVNSLVDGGRRIETDLMEVLG